mmetsp:Transcript_5901/g.9366  ORF Transcript_5901/g.9366 Transcript_5901/m.9366 type:complete len:308 (+) Transcript_5901:311-1234(+)
MAKEIIDLKAELRKKDDYLAISKKTTESPSLEPKHVQVVRHHSPATGVDSSPSFSSFKPPYPTHAAVTPASDRDIKRAMSHTPSGSIKHGSPYVSSNGLQNLQHTIPALVKLLKNGGSPNECREAVHALGVAAIEEEGRKILLQIPDAMNVLGEHLNHPDNSLVRYAALTLGNVAMTPEGRTAILQINSALAAFSHLVVSRDAETARYSAMALGNMVLDERGRHAVLRQSTVLPNLMMCLHSSDKQTVRYACGALRNVAVEETGRKEVLQMPNAVEMLQDLRESKDPSTARYANACLKNLNLGARKS